MILAHTFPVALTTAPVAFNQDIKALVPRPGIIPEYLLYWLQANAATVLSIVDVANHGTKRISTDRLFDLDVPVPDVEEQTRVCNVLVGVDDAIGATNLVLSRVRTAQSAFREHILAQHSDRPPVLLGEVAHVFSGRAAGTGTSSVRVFKTRHVYDGPVRLVDPTYARDGAERLLAKELMLRSGDTLTPNMAHGTIGRVAFVEDAEEHWTVDGQVMVLRTNDPGRLNSRYLYEYMSSNIGRRALLDREKGSIFGELRGQTHLYPKDVKTIRMPLPSHEEQSLAATVCSSLDPVARLAEARRAELSRLKDGLLSQFFGRG